MSNLPPGTTPADIDEAFGPPEMDVVHGDVTVAVSAEVPSNATDAERRAALREAVEEYEQVLEATVQEVEPQ